MSDQEHKSHELLGRTIAGKFVLVEHTGAGAMGDVFRARHVALDSTVALKIMRKELAQDPMFFERFQREAKAASRLEHPNSIRVVDFGRDENIVYMAMEFLQGRDMFRVLVEDGQLSEQRIVGILLQVLSALSPAHALGIIHRDLKPENIMILETIDDEGACHDFVKVCDFGIAKLSDSRSITNTGREPDDKRSPSPSVTGFLGPSLTSIGQLVGTPEYMSPEQARGDSLDTRTDLYSVGVILYQMLTGAVPFNGESAIGIALKHVTDLPVPPSQIRSGISPELERICLKALQKPRDARYQTAREMRADLRLFSVQSFYELPDGYEFSPRPPRIERSDPMRVSRSSVPNPAPNDDIMRRVTRKLEEPTSMHPDPSEPVVLSPSAAPPPDPSERKSTFVPTSRRGLRAIGAIGLGGAAIAAFAIFSQQPSGLPLDPWLGSEHALDTDGHHVEVEVTAVAPVETPKARPHTQTRVPAATAPKTATKTEAKATPKAVEPGATSTALPLDATPLLPAPKPEEKMPRVVATGANGGKDPKENLAPLPGTHSAKIEPLDRPAPKFDRANVAMGNVRVQHGTREAITNRVKSQLPLLSACYRTALAKKGTKVDATVTMTFATDDRARIVRATVAGLNELPEAARCMESALVGQIVHPESQALTAKADVTLTLKSE